METSKACNIVLNRQSEELVIGICGPIGSGTSSVAKIIEDNFKSYNYQVNYIKISDLIKDKCNNNYKGNTDERIINFQNFGNQLREKHGNDILSQYAIREISIERTKSQESDQNNIDTSKEIKPKSRRVVTIIDSLKHPDEYRLLKLVYGNLFYLFGILCPEEIRKYRLIHNKSIKQDKVLKIIERDKSEIAGFGQKLIKLLYKSDFFIRNDVVNISSLKPRIDRYIRLILGDLNISPNIDEFAMFVAQASALRSTCLSRQVGASIFNKHGVLISSGFNDVPKFGGGTYCDEDKEEDGRCKYRYNGMCKNSEAINNLNNEIKEILSSELEKDEQSEKILKDIMNISKIKSMTEYSRAIHAEMDAIITAAREGKNSLKGCTLFTTTFPCHNCTRHIIAAGIKKVIYIEPYEKSLAKVLHNDSIAIEESSEKKLIFAPFEGVAPKKYIQLFQSRSRKKDGKKIIIDLNSSMNNKIPKFLNSYIQFEIKIVEYIEKQENQSKEILQA